MLGLIVSMINWLAFGVPLQPMHMGPVVLTAAVIAFVFNNISSQPTHAQINTPEPPAVLQRLDLHKRGELISISVTGPLCEVTTSKGASLILMRLDDAVRETGDVGGGAADTPLSLDCNAAYRQSGVRWRQGLTDAVGWARFAGEPLLYQRFEGRGDLTGVSACSSKELRLPASHCRAGTW